MSMDPGPCPICGAAHTCCTAKSGPIRVPQLPARDARAVGQLETPPLVGAIDAAATTQAEIIQATLPAGSVTTGTYRRPKRRR